MGPKRLIKLAARYAVRNSGCYDEVWCVIDVDEFDIEPTVRLAKESGVRLAVSNPCFELWLFLHQEDYNSTNYVDGYDDAVARLRNYLPNYDKSQLDFADCASGVSRAIEKAKVLDPGKNPSTDV